ncbi:hypothetical protein [Microbispora sp. H11081]|uniref:hypothetical protein n=1 Tax=Microbispora sp. H11081 TaxID=2729107 RepID=UPI001472950B|nr:hypothetical protein [Microbispora sp. H11081]
MAFTQAACIGDEQFRKPVDDEIKRRGRALVAVVHCFVDRDVIARRSRAVALVSIAAILLLTGCDRGEQRPAPTDNEVKRRDAALVAVVQCLVDHGEVPHAHLEDQPWLKDK